MGVPSNHLFKLRFKMKKLPRDARCRESGTACGPELEMMLSRDWEKMCILTPKDWSSLVLVWEELSLSWATLTSSQPKSSKTSRWSPSDVPASAIRNGPNGSTPLSLPPEFTSEETPLHSYQDAWLHFATIDKLELQLFAGQRKPSADARTNQLKSKKKRKWCRQISPLCSVNWMTIRNSSPTDKSKAFWTTSTVIKR